MSGSTIGTVVGGAIGFMVSGPSGISMGMSIGGFAGSILMPDKVGIQDKVGPRLHDVKVTTATYGKAINRLYGTYRLQGNIIFSKNIKETMHQREEEVGKGGSETYTVTWYTYSIDMAIAFCEGPVSGIRKIWADSVKIYDISEGGTTDSYRASEQASGTLTFYLGTSDQSVDWFLQSYKPDTPAYRNVCYIVFNNFQLEKYGNRIPNITAEIVKDGGITNYVSNDPDIRRTVTYCPDETEDGILRNPYVCYHSEEYDILIYEGSTSGSVAECVYHDIYKYNNYNKQLTFLNRSKNSESSFTAKTPETMYSNSDNEYILVATTANSRYYEFVNYLSGEKYYAYPGSISYGNSDGATSPFYYDRTLYKAYRVNDYLTTLVVGVPTESGSNLLNIDLTIYLDNAIGMFVTENIYYYFLRKFSASAYSVIVYDDNWNLINEVTFTSIHNITPTTYNTIQIYIDTEYNIAYIHRYYNSNSYLHKLNLITGEHNLYTLPISDYVFRSFIVKDNILRVLKNTYFQYIHLNILSSNSVSVGSICSDLLQKSNINISEIDTTNINSIYTKGFVLTDTMSARAALDILGSVYLFDLIETDFIIKSKLRGSNSILNIYENDLIESNETSFKTIDKLDTEIPRKLTIKYSDDTIDYQTNSQVVLRIDSSSDNNYLIEVPIVLSNTEAKQIAEIILFNSWNEKTTFEFSIPSNFLYIAPGDIITLYVYNYSIDVRILSLTLMPDMSIDVVAINESTYTSNALSEDNLGFVDDLPHTVGKNDTIFINCPTLDNSLLNTVGLYVAVSGYNSNWKGSEIYKSTDQGVSYESLDVALENTYHGITIGKLEIGNHTIWDLENSVEISLSYGYLEQSTIENILNGQQYALIGNEVIQFVDVTYNSYRNTYTISKLLRGRRGTEWAIPTHYSGELFTLLNYNMIFIPSTINTEYYYKSVSFGGYIIDYDDIPATANGTNLMPFSVGTLEVINSISFDDYIYWERRDRYISGYMRTLPLSESIEEYTLNIYDHNNLLIDTKILNSPTHTVTTQDKINYGLILGYNVTYEIYQNDNGIKTTISPKTKETYLSYVLDNAYRVYRLDGNSSPFYCLRTNYPMALETGILYNQEGGLPKSNNTCIRTNNTITQAGTDLVNDRVLSFSRFSLSILFRISKTEDTCTIAHLGYEKGIGVDVVALKVVRSGSNLYIGHSTWGTNKYVKTVNLNDYINKDWVFIFVDNNDNDYRVYVNGLLHDVIARTENANHSFHIGGTPVGGDKRYDVTVDEAILYNKWGFSPNTIAYIYNLMKEELQ